MGNRMGVFVYMLRCSDDSFYIGSATGEDLSKRIAEHDSGAYLGYTFTRRPVRLVWSEHFDRVTDAIAVERKLKGWSRAKKEALARNEWSTVARLAKASRWPSETQPVTLRCPPGRKPGEPRRMAGRRPSRLGDFVASHLRVTEMSQ